MDVKTNCKEKLSNPNMFCGLCKDDGKEESEIHLLKSTNSLLPFIVSTCQNNTASNTNIFYSSNLTY